MDQNVELLKDVVRNARTGLEAVTLMMEKTDDEALLLELLCEKEQYQEIEREAQQRLFDRNEKPDNDSMMARNGVWMGMQVNTMLDKSVSHMADMLIQGSTMGVVEMTRQRNKYPAADEANRQMATRLIDLGNASIERAKEFLAVGV